VDDVVDVSLLNGQAFLHLPASAYSNLSRVDPIYSEN
jgi:hypothetical protein